MLTEQLGEGFSAAVYRARSLSGKQVAIKVFDLSNPKFGNRMTEFVNQEVVAAQEMDH